MNDFIDLSSNKLNTRVFKINIKYGHLLLNNINKLEIHMLQLLI